MQGERQAEFNALYIQQYTVNIPLTAQGCSRLGVEACSHCKQSVGCCLCVCRSREGDLKSKICEIIVWCYTRGVLCAQEAGQLVIVP